MVVVVIVSLSFRDFFCKLRTAVNCQSGKNKDKRYWENRENSNSGYCANPSIVSSSFRLFFVS